MRTHFSSVLAMTAALTVTLGAGAAHAAFDLTVGVSQPANVNVYATARYTVRVSNVGNQTSPNGTTLTIQLPRTNTSPTVSVLGTVGAMSTGCVRSGTTITCPVARIGRGSNQPFFFDLMVPQSSDDVQITATVTASSEQRRDNNSRTHTVALLNIDHALTAANVRNRHCTGTGLTSFFECELYPSSISFHDTVLNSDHTVSIPIAPDYTGTWSQPAPDMLVFQYRLDGEPVADFIGYGVGGGCFEGVTTFPDSNYVAPYEVCVTP